MSDNLRRRKENAYAVDLELEDRVVYLDASPQAIAWDLHGERLLYHRAEWHYRIVKGSEPEEIFDWGRVDAVICELPAAAGSLTDVAQGQAFAVVASDQMTENPGFAGPRIVEMIAADPTSGGFAVYSHRGDLTDPFVTDLKSFTAIGGILSFAAIPQPIGSNVWHVPHAVMYDGWLYAIERDDTIWPDSPVTGRVVRRNAGAVGALTTFLDLPVDEQWIFPHSLAYDPYRERLYLLVSKWNDPGTFEAHETSGLTTLDAATLSILDERPADFGFDEYHAPPGELRPFAWPWQAGGAPSTGGFLVFDGDETTVQFLSTAHADPSIYTPEAILPDEWATFRWRPAGRGEHIETVGPGLPVPLYRTGSGLIGAFQSTLPPEELSL
jgi:hypothetical protein